MHEIYRARELSPINRIFYAFEGTALRNAKFLIFPEPTRLQLYRKKYGLTCPLFIVNNCPRLRKASRWDPRAAWKLPKDSVLMAYVGGIGSSNALEEGIRAIKDCPRIHFLIWGWGKSDYLLKLKSAANDAGVADRVIFGGELDQNKWETLDGCDIGYCIYRHSELRMKHQATASNKLMEAMASGEIALTSDSPDFQAFLADTKFGVTTALEIPVIAQTLNRLLEDPAAMERMRETALAEHRNRYHYEFQFKEALQFLKENFGKPGKTKAAA